LLSAASFIHSVPIEAGEQSRRSSDVLKQLGYAVRYLGALALPVFNAIRIDTQPLFLAARSRVEKADALDKTAIACVAAIGHREVVKGAFLGAASS
jgi:protein-arginine kinase